MTDDKTKQDLKEVEVRLNAWADYCQEVIVASPCGSSLLGRLAGENAEMNRKGIKDSYAKPHACLISGQGYKPEPEYTEEEEIEYIIENKLPDSIAAVVRLEYLESGRQEDKAKKLGIKRRCYQDYLRIGKFIILSMLKKV